MTQVRLIEKNILMESCRVLIQFQDKPSARPTFVSAKVGKTIVIRKTR